MYFLSLPKLYHCHCCLIKKTIKKDLVEMVESKTTCLEWHFGQVGHGGKKTIWGVFFY
jgi:hypothetical protein